MELEAGVYVIDCFRLGKLYPSKTKRRIAEDLSWVIFQTNPTLARTHLSDYTIYPAEKGKLIFLNLSYELEHNREFRTLLDKARDNNCRVVIFSNGSPSQFIRERSVDITVHIAEGAKI